MKSSTIAYIFFTMWMSFSSTFGMAATNDMERNLRVAGADVVDTGAAAEPTPVTVNLAELSGPDIAAMMDGYERYLESFKEENGERSLQETYRPPRICVNYCAGYVLGRCHLVYPKCWPW